MPGTSGPDHMFPDEPETTSYMVQMPADDWAEWKDSIPRSRPLYDRLHALIQIDTAFDGEADLAELRLVTMKFQRIEQRCMTALDALHDDDVEKVREELRTMRNMAAPFSE